MNKVEKIYIHCSASGWGNQNTVNSWHRVRRFLTMVDGYHRIIGNGIPFSDLEYESVVDGNIEIARSYNVQGAGVKGDNVNSIHICLIGKPGDFTKAQVKSIFKLLKWHVDNGVGVDSIWGHYEYWTCRGRDPLKTCPGIDMDKFRDDLRAYLKNGRVRTLKSLDIELDNSILWKILDLINAKMGGSIEEK